MTADTAEIDVRTSTDAAALGRAAFNRIAARDFDGARPVLERALSLQPRDIMLAHIKAHLTTDSGAYREGAAYLRAFLAQDDGTHGMHAHTSWHLADIEVELGRPAAALDLHERYVAPRVATLPVAFYSAVTLLWRLELLGFGSAQGRQLPWERMRAAGSAILSAPIESSGLANPPALDDIAHGMTSIATDDEHGLAALFQRLRGADSSPDSLSVEVVCPLLLGLRAFWQGDYLAALDAIEPVTPSFGRLTKFADQLIVLEDTFVEAQLRAGRFTAAETRLRDRPAKQPTPLPRDLYWLGRALHGQGRSVEAATTLRAARQRWQDAEADAPEIIALDSLLAA